MPTLDFCQEKAFKNKQKQNEHKLFSPPFHMKTDMAISKSETLL